MNSPGCAWRIAAPAVRSHVLTSSQSRLLPRISASFSTTPSPRSPAAPQKPGQKKDGKRKRVKHAYKNKGKKNLPATQGNVPAPGERRALKKRVVLSNVNALDISDLEDLSETTKINESLQNKVLGLPGHIVDRLRSLEAFKPSQNWSLFKRPSVLIRPETIEIGGVLERAIKEKTSQRLIITGERGSGKSVLLLQSEALALLKDWVVITIPEARDLVNARTDYSPLNASDPAVYVQPTYVKSLLGRIALANPVLETLEPLNEKTKALPHSKTIRNLADLCKSAEHDKDQAWDVFEALSAELRLPGRPPVFIALDGLANVMQTTAYRSADFKLVHAHDLALVRWFLGHLSGKNPLPNGGVVLAATTHSGVKSNPTLDARLAQLAVLKGSMTTTTSNSTDNAILPANTAPSLQEAFLTATGQQAAPIPPLDPLARHDLRVLAALGGGVDTKPAATSVPDPAFAPRVLHCAGLDRAGARQLIEHWARSGMLRAAVTAPLVAERWAVAGGGIIGELERSCLRMRL